MADKVTPCRGIGCYFFGLWFRLESHILLMFASIVADFSIGLEASTSKLPLSSSASTMELSYSYFWSIYFQFTYWFIFFSPFFVHLDICASLGYFSLVFSMTSKFKKMVADLLYFDWVSAFFTPKIFFTIFVILYPCRSIDLRVDLRCSLSIVLVCIFL